MATKRKHTVLSLADKIKIIKRLNNGESGRILAAEYGVGSSTISDIRRKSDCILKFVSVLDSEKGSTRKTMKKAKNGKLEAAVYEWFIEKKSAGQTISGPVLCETAVTFNERLGGNPDFKASSGWLRNFKSRHGILDGEKLSANKEQADKSGTKQSGTDCINSVDATGLTCKTVPKKSVASKSEIAAPSCAVNCASKGETSSTAADLSNQIGGSTNSQLQPDIKIEEHNLASETIEELDQSQPQSSYITTDPLIKSESEDDEAFLGQMEHSDIGLEALQLLPETSEDSQIRLTKVKAQLALRARNRDKLYCRLCFQYTSKTTMLPLGALDLNYPGKTEAFKKKKMKNIQEVEKMLQLCLPFFESLTFNPVICSTCLIRLKTCYEFTSKCLQNQQHITDYIESHGTTERIVIINEMMASKFVSQNVSKPPCKTSVVTKKNIPNLSKKVSSDPSNSLQQQSHNQLEKDYTKIQSSSQERLAQCEPHAVYRPAFKKRKIQSDLQQEETLEDSSFDSSKNVHIKTEPDHDYSLPAVERLYDTSQKNVDTTDPPVKIERDDLDCPEFIKTEPLDEIENIKTENETVIRTGVENSIFLSQSGSWEVESDCSYSNSITTAQKGTKGSSLEHIEQIKLNALNNT